MFNFDSKLKEIESNKELVGTVQNGLIEKNYYMYHIIQQTNNRMNFFTSEVAKHRDFVFKAQCSKNDVVPIINVIMPTHTHDVVFASDFESIVKTVRNTNKGTSSFIKHRYQNQKGTENKRVFATYPGYVAIKTRIQLWNLVKYLYDNPAYLKARGDYVPYSCFESWSQNYFKPYDKTILEGILGVDTGSLLVDCSKLTKEEWIDKGKLLYKNDTEEYCRKLFAKKQSIK